MIGILGLVLVAAGVLGFISGVGIESQAQSAFHQTYAALIYMGSAIIGAIGVSVIALSYVLQRLKSIDESLTKLHIEAKSTPSHDDKSA